MIAKDTIEALLAPNLSFLSAVNPLRAFASLVVIINVPLILSPFNFLR